jgi:hypothetical protein
MISVIQATAANSDNVNNWPTAVVIVAFFALIAIMIWRMIK